MRVEMRCVDFRPRFYYRQNRMRRHIGECEVVFGRERYDVAFAGCAFCAQ